MMTYPMMQLCRALLQQEARNSIDNRMSPNGIHDFEIALADGSVIEFKGEVSSIAVGIDVGGHITRKNCIKQQSTGHYYT